VKEWHVLTYICVAVVSGSGSSWPLRCVLVCLCRHIDCVYALYFTKYNSCPVVVCDFS
jgi:hypothetical protein